MSPSTPTKQKAVQAVKVGVVNSGDVSLRDNSVDQYETPYQVNEIPVPRPGDNDILVKIGAAGYCHTEYVIPVDHN